MRRPFLQMRGKPPRGGPKRKAGGHWRDRRGSRDYRGAWLAGISGWDAGCAGVRVRDMPRPAVKSTPGLETRDVPRPEAKNAPRPGVKGSPGLEMRDVPRPEAKNTPRLGVMGSPGLEMRDVPGPEAKNTPRPGVKGLPGLNDPRGQLPAGRPGMGRKKRQRKAGHQSRFMGMFPAPLFK